MICQADWEFGTIGGGNFRGTGSGADRFLFTLTLIQTTCLAVGLIDLVSIWAD